MSVRSGPISPPPVTSYSPEYLPAYLSNGLIGLRVGRIPLTDGICVVNGLVQRDPVEDGEGFARGPYPLGGDIQVDGHHLRYHPREPVFVEQAYDFSCGELRSSFTFQPESTTARVDVLVFCSRSLPTLVLHELTVEVDAECELVLTSGLSPAGVAGGWIARRTRTPGSEVPTVDGLMEWETNGGFSTCGAAYVTTFAGAEGVERRVEELDTLAPLCTSYRFRAHPGRRYVLQQVSSLISSQLHSEPDRQAVRMAYLGASRGFETLRQQNREVWAELWKGRLLLHGADERWQGIADSSFYYLQASAHHSSLFSTSMFGLASWTNYDYYRGHVMWDIECFALPVLLLTNPPTARALLGYRLERLRAAVRNASMNGYQGLQFPWAASPVHGEEVVSLRKPLVAVFEQHVNMVVAFAFAQYCHATGDEQFLREQAWPVLSGVAAWIASRVVRTPRGVEIRECLGIAEQEGPVDNHAYVNMAAAVVLREAAHAARCLAMAGTAEEHWEELADRMFIPVDEGTNVILNHEGYVYRESDVAAATPETLVGFFPFTYRADPERERATLRFYLERVDAYVGYPMLSAPLGAWAARLGDRELSARLFEAGYAEFIDEPFRVTNEFSPRRFPDRPRAGPLVANVGGFLTSCLLGLTGIVLRPGEVAAWCQREAVMPSLWEGIEVERIWVRCRPARLVAQHGARARIEPLS